MKDLGRLPLAGLALAAALGCQARAADPVEKKSITWAHVARSGSEGVTPAPPFEVELPGAPVRGHERPDVALGPLTCETETASVDGARFGLWRCGLDPRMVGAVPAMELLKDLNTELLGAPTPLGRPPLIALGLFPGLSQSFETEGRSHQVRSYLVGNQAFLLWMDAVQGELRAADASHFFGSFHVLDWAEHKPARDPRPFEFAAPGTPERLRDGYRWAGEDGAFEIRWEDSPVGASRSGPDAVLDARILREAGPLVQVDTGESFPMPTRLLTDDSRTFGYPAREWTHSRGAGSARATHVFRAFAVGTRTFLIHATYQGAKPRAFDPILNSFVPKISG